MNNYKIVIDPGHGGIDSGASGNGIIEKDKTLEISKYMYDRFKELGIPVAITRDSDTTLSPTERVNSILSKFGNNSDVIVISNHINAGGGDGAEVIYALRNNSNLANLIADNIRDANQNVRKVYQRRLPSDPSKDYYFIHRNTGVTQPLIVEYGFLDGSGDDVSKLKNNWRDLTEAVVKAIALYTNTPYNIYNNNENTYTVKSGDSLWSIARRYNITVDKLKELNNLNSNLLKIGQKLIISEDIEEPNNIEDYIIYRVKRGDTLYNIANSYNISVDELKSYNNLTNNILSINQEIKIPIKNIEEEQQNTEFTEYIVKRGDSLYSISRTYGIPVDEIMKFNNLNTNLLSIGQIIRIPISQESNIEYTVKNGDTLYSIARTYNTTVDNIKSKNNLINNILVVGQKLII